MPTSATLVRYKARLVAKGFGQIPGQDYNETFAPVACFQSIHTTLAVAAQKQWPMFQVDVNSDCLYGKLDKEIYMEQPAGFVNPGKEPLSAS